MSGILLCISWCWDINLFMNSEQKAQCRTLRDKSFTFSKTYIFCEFEIQTRVPNFVSVLFCLFACWCLLVRLLMFACSLVDVPGGGQLGDWAPDDNGSEPGHFLHREFSIEAPFGRKYLRTDSNWDKSVLKVTHFLWGKSRTWFHIQMWSRLTTVKSYYAPPWCTGRQGGRLLDFWTVNCSLLTAHCSLFHVVKHREMFTLDLLVRLCSI